MVALILRMHSPNKGVTTKKKTLGPCLQQHCLSKGISGLGGSWVSV